MNVFFLPSHSENAVKLLPAFYEIASELQPLGSFPCKVSLLPLVTFAIRAIGLASGKKGREVAWHYHSKREKENTKTFKSMLGRPHCYTLEIGQTQESAFSTSSATILQSDGGSVQCGPRLLY